jgi:hypothetical protein
MTTVSACAYRRFNICISSQIFKKCYKKLCNWGASLNCALEAHSHPCGSYIKSTLSFCLHVNYSNEKHFVNLHVGERCQILSDLCKLLENKIVATFQVPFRSDNLKGGFTWRPRQYGVFTSLSEWFVEAVIRHSVCSMPLFRTLIICYWVITRRSRKPSIC